MVRVITAIQRGKLTHMSVMAAEASNEELVKEVAGIGRQCEGGLGKYGASFGEALAAAFDVALQKQPEVSAAGKSRSIKLSSDVVTLEMVEREPRLIASEE